MKPTNDFDEVAAILDYAQKLSESNQVSQNTLETLRNMANEALIQSHLGTSHPVTANPSNN